MTFARSLRPRCAQSLCRRREFHRPRHDIRSIAKIVREHDDTLLIVDAITGSHHALDVMLGRGCDYRRFAEGADDSLAWHMCRERALVEAMDETILRDTTSICARKKIAAKGESSYTRRPRCSRRWEPRWSLSGRWATGLAKGPEVLVDNAELCAG